MELTPKDYISIAIEKSQHVDLAEVPVVAIFLNSLTNEYFVYSNKVYSKKDPTAHAEILGIRDLCNRDSTTYLNVYDVFVNLEPCVMCAQAMSNARIRKLYFAAYDFKSGGVENGVELYYAKSCHYKPEFYGGILSSQASEIISRYFSKLRV